MVSDEALLYVLGAVAVLGGAYLTSLMCRCARGQLVWRLAILGTLGSGMFTGFLVLLGFSLPPGDIGKGFEPSRIASWIFLFACACALPPALVTVYVFKRKSKRVDGQEEKLTGR